jgi:hypothetical protein
MRKVKRVVNGTVVWDDGTVSGVHGLVALALERSAVLTYCAAISPPHQPSFLPPSIRLQSPFPRCLPRYCPHPALPPYHHRETHNRATDHLDTRALQAPTLGPGRAPLAASKP